MADEKLISASNLANVIRDDPYIGSRAFARVKQHIDDAPDAVKRGRWETIEVTEDWEDVKRYHHFHRECKYSYCDNGLSGHYFCPFCGAKMDGGDNDGKKHTGRSQ